MKTGMPTRVSIATPDFVSPGFVERRKFLDEQSVGLLSGAEAAAVPIRIFRSSFGPSVSSCGKKMMSDVGVSWISSLGVWSQAKPDSWNRSVSALSLRRVSSAVGTLADR